VDEEARLASKQGVQLALICAAPIMIAVPNPPYEERKFPMLRAAWNAGERLLDDRANLRGDLSEAAATFLRRKCCHGLPANDCRAAFLSAVEIARAAIRFRRAKCPINPPKAARRDELLFSLAKQLESTFPDAD
jgi:hypothetical protein